MTKPLPHPLSDAKRGAASRPSFSPLRSERGRGRGSFASMLSPYPTCPTGGEEPRVALCHPCTLSHPAASLPPSWARAGEGGPLHAPSSSLSVQGKARKAAHFHAPKVRP